MTTTVLLNGPLAEAATGSEGEPSLVIEYAPDPSYRAVGTLELPADENEPLEAALGYTDERLRADAHAFDAMNKAHTNEDDFSFIQKWTEAAAAQLAPAPSNEKNLRSAAGNASAGIR